MPTLSAHRLPYPLSGNIPQPYGFIPYGTPIADTIKPYAKAILFGYFSYGKFRVIEPLGFWPAAQYTTPPY